MLKPHGDLSLMGTQNLEALNYFAQVIYHTAANHIEAGEKMVHIDANDLLVWAIKALYTMPEEK